MGTLSSNECLLLVFFSHIILEKAYGIAIGQTPNVTQCGNLTCLHNAKCRIDSQGDQFCMCQTGYEGTTCNDDFDECSLGNPCMHRGLCSNTIGSYRCTCLHGWFGSTHCEIKDNSTSIRNCTLGWMGEWCQDQCLNDSMCRQTEVCKKRGRGLRCICSQGWSSRNCSVDIDECQRSPCKKNMLCINTPGSFFCTCLTGLTGSNCDTDIDECARNPCKHSSTCMNEHGYYNCTCANGWRGNNCEKDINECESYSCNSSYVCENNPGSFSCSIKQSSLSRENYTKNMHFIIGAILGSILMLCSILTWLGILKYRWTTSRDKRSIRDEEKKQERKKFQGENYTKNMHFIIGAILGSILMLCSILTWLGILKYRWTTSRDKRSIRDEEKKQERKKFQGKEEKRRTVKKQTMQTQFINKKWVH